MHHKHHSTHQLCIFSLSIIVLGGAFGACGALHTQSIFTDASASSFTDASDMRRDQAVIKAAERRKARRAERLKRLKEQGRKQNVTRMYPSHNAALVPKKDPLEVEIGYATLRIPSLGIEAPVNRPSNTFWDRAEWAAYERQMQKGHDNGTSLYANAPHEFWMKGTFVFTGHSSPPTISAKHGGYGYIFRDLHKINIGDTVEVRDKYGRLYTYEIIETDVIHPSNTSILKQQRDVVQAVFMTCYPPGTTKNRFVATGKLVPAAIASL